MADGVKIESLDELGDWLKTQDVQVSQTIAARAALRSLPAAMNFEDSSPETAEHELVLLACFRAALIAVIASICSESTISEVREAAFSAAGNSIRRLASRSDAQSTFNAADSAMCTAPGAAAAAALSTSRFSAAVLPSFSEAEMLTTIERETIHSSPLWRNFDEGARMLLIWGRYSQTLDPLGTWRFWRRWYQGFLDGKPLDWELQRSVALIDNAIWEAGPKAVAAEILEIEAEWVAEQLPQADRIFVDEDTGKFDISPLALSPAGIVQTALEQVAFARGVAERSNCGFNTTSVAWEYIEFTLNSCRENANAIEQNFEIARADIADGLKNGRYFEDPKLAALERVLDTAVTDLRAHHPEVIEAWEKRVQVKLRIAQDDQKQLIVEKATELIAASAPALGEELELDAKTIASSAGEAQSGAIRRFFGRVAQMRLLVRSGEVVKKIDASSGYKGTRIVQTLQSLVDLIVGIWPF